MGGVMNDWMKKHVKVPEKIVLFVLAFSFNSFPTCWSFWAGFTRTHSLHLRPFSRSVDCIHYTLKSSRHDEVEISSNKSLFVSTLEKRTVKDLREMIKHIQPNLPKGASSKLKLKRDLVDFLANNEEMLELFKKRVAQSTKENYRNGSGSTLTAPPTSKVNSLHDDNNMTNIDSKLQRGRKAVKMRMPELNTYDAMNSNDENEENDQKTKKELIYDEVLERYPELNQTSQNHMISTEMIDEKEDIRSKHHPMLRNLAPASDMDVSFIGTASCIPSVTRGVSCTAVRLNWRFDQGQILRSAAAMAGGIQNNSNKQQNPNTYDSTSGGIWLFDCGECTQLQLQKSSHVKARKITKIFITHCHGDHSFGLPGLLCLMGQDRPRDLDPIEIYGPEGIRMWLRIAIRYSMSRIVPNYRVHELIDVPMAPEWKLVRNSFGQYRYIYDWNRINRNSGSKDWMNEWGNSVFSRDDPYNWVKQSKEVTSVPMDPQYGEVEGGRDIYPQYDHPLCSSGAPIWQVVDDPNVAVHAAPMSHGVPTVGYVIEEPTKPGRLRPESVVPIIQRNTPALKAAGVQIPMKVMAVIKNMPLDGEYKFPDGTIVKHIDVVEPPRSGRKIVICGDTTDSRALENLAKDADVLVHEATNTYLEGFDLTNEDSVERDAQIHGHSTPRLAGRFAKKINAKRLLLNHFSPRYKGNISLDSIVTMTRIEKQAIEASGLPVENVAAAWDFMNLPVPQRL